MASESGGRLAYEKPEASHYCLNDWRLVLKRILEAVVVIALEGFGVLLDEIQDENTKLEILGKTAKQGSLIAVLELVGQLSEVCRIVVAAL